MRLCAFFLIFLLASWSLAAEVTSLTNSSQCVLPPYPDNGIYEVLNVPSARPGQSYSSAVLRVKCRRGYGVANQQRDGSVEQIYCIVGTWYQTMIQCVRFCKLDPHPSVTYTCDVPGQGIQPCNSYVPPNTTVEPVCNTPIYYSNEVLLRMKCYSGYWNYIARCKAECGRITPNGRQLIIDGTQVKHGEMPWHVGIYRLTNMKFNQICGGSLVSENVVISAAHCFWTDTDKQLPAYKFAVATGKLHRSWDSEKDAGAQKSYVKEIQLSSLYEGVAANFQEDIAALILWIPFNFTTYIQPVCLNFQPMFDNMQLQHGKLGKVAGWGLTAANGNASEVLNVVEMPFISIDVCIATLPPSFRAYITGDKFCAGYINGTSVCMGDSGGGLAFPGTDLGIDRYYLRGVLSTAPNDENKKCNDHTYSTFTKITKHEELIKEALAASGPICPPFWFQCDDGACANPGSDCNGRQDCADGSDEFGEYCLIPSASVPTSTSESYSECGVFDGNKNERLPWSAYIAIGRKYGTLYYVGAIIADQYVMYTGWHKELQPEGILVGFGEYNPNTFKFAAERHVIRISNTEEHEGFNHFLTILKLDQRLEYNADIRPACLWDDKIPQGFVTPTMFPIWFISSFTTPTLIVFDYNATVLNDSSPNLVIPYQTILSHINFKTFLYILYEGKWRLYGIIMIKSSVNEYVKLAPYYLSYLKNELK